MKYLISYSLKSNIATRLIKEVTAKTAADAVNTIYGNIKVSHIHRVTPRDYSMRGAENHTIVFNNQNTGERHTGHADALVLMK